MKSVDYLVIHCSATPPSSDIGVKEIDAWHKKRGWRGCGYHHVIRRDGTLEAGRPESKAGAHVLNFNHCSIGVCLVGGLNKDRRAAPEYTEAQWKTLAKLIRELRSRYPRAKIQGHRDFPEVNKACPCFDVETWCKDQGIE